MRVQDLYEKVTHNIISEIEAGNLPPWLKPWKQGKRTGIIPVNAATNAHYNGLNVLTLWGEREHKQYPTAFWITYRQCQVLGGQVRGGEKGTHIIFAKPLRKETDESCDTIKGYDNALPAFGNARSAESKISRKASSETLCELREASHSNEQMRLSSSDGQPHQRGQIQKASRNLEGTSSKAEGEGDGGLRGEMSVLRGNPIGVPQHRPHQRRRTQTSQGSGEPVLPLDNSQPVSADTPHPLHELQHGGSDGKVSSSNRTRSSLILKTYVVFNVAQCDGLPHNEPEPELPELERNEKAEAFFAAVGAEVRWNEAMAAYIPSKDCIIMPPRGAFHSPENLYATYAHEHIHYTGHKSRLDRDLKSRFDKEAYAFEELVAEIGAAMTCATLQVTGELRHASYVESWLKVLKGDPKAILTAASMASKATDYLRSFSEPKAVAA